MHKLAPKFLELYKSSKSLQEIADLYNISRERVRQIISTHPDYNPRDRTTRMALYYEKAEVLKFEGKGVWECLVCHCKAPIPGLGKEFGVCSICRKQR